MSQQSLRQASIRAVTSTTYTYEGDWHALWDLLGIAAGQFNERMLLYINNQLDTSYTEVNGAMAAFAAEHGSTTFQAIGTFTPGFSLTAPVLTWTSGVNVATAVFEIVIPEDVPSGYKVYGEASLSSGGAAFDTETAVIAAGDLTDLQIDDFAFSAFTSGAKYVRVRLLTDADVVASDWSNIVTKTLDVDAPTITSANSANNAENSVLAHALTANESVTWTITGGVDAAEFEISGSTLRWASNGTQDYETPGDDGANNTYVVQVTATDAATNATNQTITITVTDVAEGDADVLAYLARATGMDSTHEDAFTDLIVGLKADGVWNLLDCLYIFATDTEAHALLNVRSSSYNLTKNGTPTFSADVGFWGVAGDGTKYLDTGFNPSTAGGNYTQNSAHISAWSNTNTFSDSGAMGHDDGTNQTNLFPTNGGNSYFRINDTIYTGINVGGGSEVSYVTASRTGSGATEGYRNGASVVTGTPTSKTLINNNIYICGYNANGTAQGSSLRLSAATIGGGLDDTKAAALYNRLAAYRTAVGL